MSLGTPPTRQLRTVAGIVAFHPDPSGLLQLIATTAPDVTRVVVFANSPLDRSMKERVAAAAGATPVTVMAPGQNVGLGKAYNRIIELARLESAQFVLLFDQDSLPSAGMVRRLEDLADELGRRGENPAIVGPRPVNASGEPLDPAPPLASRPNAGSRRRFRDLVGIPRRLDRCSDRRTVPRGLLHRCDRHRMVLEGLGGRLVGGARYGHCNDHRLGKGVIHLPFGMRMTDQPPERLILISAIRLRCCACRTSRAWKLRFVASLLVRSFIYAVRNRFARPVVKAIGLGLADGMMNRLGRPPGDQAATDTQGSKPTMTARSP